MCVLGVSTLPLSTIFLLNFGTVPTVLYYFFQFVSYSLGIEIISYKLLFIAEYDYHHGY